MCKSNIFKFCHRNIGLISYSIFLCFAIYFYQERTLFLDNAFQVFLMIVDGNIVVNADRWPATIVRFLPFAFIKTQAPLQLVLLSFSLSYWLFHFAIFLMLSYGLKDKTLGLLQLSTATIPLMHSFYWCNSELNLAISVLLLTYAFYKKRHWWTFGILSFVLLWLHPLVFIPYIFLWIMEGLNRFKKASNFTTFKNIEPVLIATGFFLLFVIKRTFFKNWYDTMKSKVFSENLSDYDFINMDFFHALFIDAHVLFMVVFGLALSYTLYKKMFLKSLFFFLFVCAYLMILDISKSVDRAQDFYNEVNFIIIFFASAYILKDWVKELSQRLQLSLFGVLVLFVTFNWITTARFYTQRMQWIEAMAQRNDRKILSRNSEIDDMLILDWGSAYESIVICSLNGKSKTFIVTDDKAKFIAKGSEELFYGAFKTYPIEKINNSYYFDLETLNYTHKLD